MFGKNFLFSVYFVLSALSLTALSFTAAQDNESKLSFSHKHGFYYAPFELQISSSIAGAKIKYTLDGTNPLTSGLAQESVSPARLTVDPTQTNIRDMAPGYVVTACAVLNDTLASKVITQTYLFPNKIVLLSPNNQVPGKGWLVPGADQQMISYGLDPRVYNDATYGPQMEKSFMSIPTLSLVTDLKNLFNADSGIYVNAEMHSETWERQASLELMNPDSSDEGFQINCGLRIRGGWSRHNDDPKHAFRVFFRDKYGKGKLEYPVFGDEGAKKFDMFDIQTSQNYSWAYYGDLSNTFLRELFSRDTQRDMGQPYARGKFCHLYINGSYFGLYQIEERPESSYGETYFGGSKEDYDVIKINPGDNFSGSRVEATDGTINKWRELWDAGQKGFSSDEQYFKVQGLNLDGTVNPAYDKLVDVDNLIDYMLIIFYTGNFDAPISAFGNNAGANNFFAVYNRVKPDGFKFFQHDAEHSLFLHEWGIDRTGPFSAGTYFDQFNPQWLHQKLSDNANYRLRFADRVYKYFFNGGALTLQQNIERLNKRKAQIETAIIAESARWGDSKTSLPLTKTDWINAVNFIPQSFFPNRISVVLGQLTKKGLYISSSTPGFNQPGGIVEKGFNVNLSAPGLGKIYYTTDGTDPYSPFAEPGSVFSRTVVQASSAKKVLVPNKEIDSLWRRDPSFDDSSWLSCSGDPGGIGYEAGSGYESFLSLSLKSYMYTGASDPNNTCYIRIPFDITEDELSKINNMELQIMYDDGFAAYINGVRAAEANAPVSLSYNSAATNYTEADKYYSFDLSKFTSLLKPGKNLLAIHGMNNSITSSDLLFLPKLIVSRTAQAGRISDGAKEYKDAISINKTTTIKARTLTGSSWSPLGEATFIIKEDLSPLRVTELHYHPLGQDTISDKAYEFIELKNCGSTELQLKGASFVQGITYTFGDVTLAPGAFIVLASNKDEFNRRYGFMPFDAYSGQLDNNGEKVGMVNAAGDTVFSFSYNDKAPWPEEADGKGYSLVAKDPNASGNPGDPSYWVRSAAMHGSPGKNDPATSVETRNDAEAVKSFNLMQNYPNPFNPSTVISYELPAAVHVEIKVYDALGQMVKELVNKQQAAGRYRVQFDAKGLASGVYFYTIKAGDFVKTQKMVMVR